MERGSTHILFQNEILKEEYDLLGLKPNLPSSHIIEVEQEEYKIADHIMVPSEFAKSTFIKKALMVQKLVKYLMG